MYALSLTADLVGVTSLQPVDSESSPHYYTFTLVCTSCRETHPNAVGVSRFDSNDMSGSRGVANFVFRCKNCKRESSADIKTAPKPYKRESPPTRQDILEIECRGLEFTGFKPDGEWACEAAPEVDEETGEEKIRRGAATVFKELDLTEGEWYDYDESKGEEVSIKDLKWEIRRV